MFMGTEAKKPGEEGYSKGNKYYLLRSKDGRDKKFKTPEDLWKACCDYFQWVKDNPLIEEKMFHTSYGIKRENVSKKRPMTLAGLRVHIGLSKAGYEVYRKREAYQWVAAAVSDIMYSQKFEGAAAGFFKENLIARELGLKDKKEFAGPGNGPISTVRLDADQYAEIRSQMLKEDDC